MLHYHGRLLVAVALVASAAVAGATDWPFDALPDTALGYVDIVRLSGVQDVVSFVTDEPWSDDVFAAYMAMMLEFPMDGIDFDRPLGLVVMPAGAAFPVTTVNLAFAKEGVDYLELWANEKVGDVTMEQDADGLHTITTTTTYGWAPDGVHTFDTVVHAAVRDGCVLVSTQREGLAALVKADVDWHAFADRERPFAQADAGVYLNVSSMRQAFGWSVLREMAIGMSMALAESAEGDAVDVARAQAQAESAGVFLSLVDQIRRIDYAVDADMAGLHGWGRLAAEAGSGLESFLANQSNLPLPLFDLMPPGGLLTVSHALLGEQLIPALQALMAPYKSLLEVDGFDLDQAMAEIYAPYTGEYVTQLLLHAGEGDGLLDVHQVAVIDDEQKTMAVLRDSAELSRTMMGLMGSMSAAGEEGKDWLTYHEEVDTYQGGSIDRMVMDMGVLLDSMAEDHGDETMNEAMEQIREALDVIYGASVALDLTVRDHLMYASSVDVKALIEVVEAARPTTRPLEVQRLLARAPRELTGKVHFRPLEFMSLFTRLSHIGGHSAPAPALDIPDSPGIYKWMFVNDGALHGAGFVPKGEVKAWKKSFESTYP